MQRILHHKSREQKIKIVPLGDVLYGIILAARKERHWVHVATTTPLQSLQEGLVQHKGDNANANYSIGLGKRFAIALRNDYLLEKVPSLSQWPRFLLFFGFVIKSKRRLNVYPVVPTVDDEINFMLADCLAAITSTH